MAVDSIQAGAQAGTGPKFAADFDSLSVNWPFSKAAFGALHTTYTIVDDSIGNRFPVKATPDGITTTDASGTGTGASQIILAANPSRKGGLIQNPPTAVEILFVNIGATAAPDNHSVALMPGDIFYLNQGGVVITDQITVYTVTAGHAFTAKSFA